METGLVVAAVAQYAIELLLSESDGSSEDEVEEIALAAVALRRRGRRICMEMDPEETVPRIRDSSFRDHFRVSRSTFYTILRHMSDLDAFRPQTYRCGRPSVSLEKQLQVTLWTLGNQESFRTVADRVDLSASTAHGIVKKFAYVLTNDLRKKVIKWPEDIAGVVSSFKRTSGGKFPGIIGSVDGCHIPVKAPTMDPLSYINRKGFHSILLQGVCDDEMLFTDVCAGWPGSVHDARVFRRSYVAEKIEHGLINPDHYIVDDSAYPLQPNLMVPFKGNPNNAQQKIQPCIIKGQDHHREDIRPAERSMAPPQNAGRY